MYHLQYILCAHLLNFASYLMTSISLPVHWFAKAVANSQIVDEHCKDNNSSYSIWWHLGQKENQNYSWSNYFPKMVSGFVASSCCADLHSNIDFQVTLVFSSYFIPNMQWKVMIDSGTLFAIGLVAIRTWNVFSSASQWLDRKWCCQHPYHHFCFIFGGSCHASSVFILHQYSIRCMKSRWL